MIFGAIYKYDRERKAVNRSNNAIRDALNSALALRRDELESIKQRQLQTRDSNEAAQASSGFTSSSFTPLKEYQEREQKKQIDMFNKETQLIEKQTLAGLQATPSKTLSTLNAIQSTAQTGLSLFSLF